MVGDRRPESVRAGRALLSNSRQGQARFPAVVRLPVAGGMAAPDGRVPPRTVATYVVPGASRRVGAKSMLRVSAS